MIKPREPSQIRDSSIARFVVLAGGKYDRGQTEHGGCLDETVSIEKLEDEIIDNWHYLQSMRYKIAQMEHNYQILAKFYEDNKPEEEAGEVDGDKDDKEDEKDAGTDD